MFSVGKLAAGFGRKIDEVTFLAYYDALETVPDVVILDAYYRLVRIRREFMPNPTEFYDECEWCARHPPNVETRRRLKSQLTLTRNQPQIEVYG